MAGVARKGAWTAPRQLHVLTVMGGAELDFREAQFGPGVTTVTVFATMGGVEIKVRLPGENARDAKRRLREARRLHWGSSNWD